MRTKSPAVVQRWVDSLPNENVTELPDDTLIEADNNQPDTITTITVDNVIEFCEPHCDSTNQNTIVAEPKVVDITNCIDKLNLDTENDIKCVVRDIEEQPLDIHVSDSSEASGTENTNSDRRFWHKGATVLTALRIRSNADKSRSTETEDLKSSLQLSQNDEEENKSTSTNPIINKSKLNEFYYKLSISRKRYNFIKDRKMEAKKLLNNAKSRFLAAANWDETQIVENETDPENQETANEEHGDNNLTAIAITTDILAATDNTTTTVAATLTSSAINELEASGASGLAVCDTIDMDLSADEFSRLSHSNDMLSADDEDSFNVSMPSIDSCATHLNVSRRIAMADIGRSTSDNPRLRNKFYLADIGRSFSEHQDDEAIIIGERNISAPSSSIAIQNNNRSNSNFFERRAYSVSPTQRGLKRGVLSRDHSLSDSSRHRNQLSKGSSFQSDSSHCSSVESLLDARKPDSEAILRQLGFGPAHQEDLLSRIPKRLTFLRLERLNYEMFS